MATKKIEAPATNLSRADIEQLLDVIHAKGIEEFELEQGGMRLRVVATRPVAAPIMMAQPVQAYAPAPQQTAPVQQQAVSAMTAPSSAPAAATPPEEDPKLKKVTSPMVGSFYRSASPGSKPFVEVGDKVDGDTVLCIIEAMKLMNEIKAETRGVVKKIMVQNGQPVEYGQTLFLIDPS